MKSILKILFIAICFVLGTVSLSFAVEPSVAVSGSYFTSFGQDRFQPILLKSNGEAEEGKYIYMGAVDGYPVLGKTDGGASDELVVIKCVHKDKNIFIKANGNGLETIRLHYDGHGERIFRGHNRDGFGYSAQICQMDFNNKSYLVVKNYKNALFVWEYNYVEPDKTKFLGFKQIMDGDRFPLVAIQSIDLSAFPGVKNPHIGRIFAFLGDKNDNCTKNDGFYRCAKIAVLKFDESRKSFSIEATLPIAQYMDEKSHFKNQLYFSDYLTPYPSHKTGEIKYFIKTYERFKDDLIAGFSSLIFFKSSNSKWRIAGSHESGTWDIPHTCSFRFNHRGDGTYYEYIAQALRYPGFDIQFKNAKKNEYDIVNAPVAKEHWTKFEKVKFKDFEITDIFNKKEHLISYAKDVSARELKKINEELKKTSRTQGEIFADGAKQKEVKRYLESGAKVLAVYWGMPLYGRPESKDYLPKYTMTNVTFTEDTKSVSHGVFAKAKVMVGFSLFSVAECFGGLKASIARNWNDSEDIHKELKITHIVDLGLEDNGIFGKILFTNDYLQLTKGLRLLGQNGKCSLNGEQVEILFTARSIGNRDAGVNDVVFSLDDPAKLLHNSEPENKIDYNVLGDGLQPNKPSSEFPWATGPNNDDTKKLEEQMAKMAEWAKDAKIDELFRLGNLPDTGVEPFMNLNQMEVEDGQYEGWGYQIRNSLDIEYSATKVTGSGGDLEGTVALAAEFETPVVKGSLEIGYRGRSEWYLKEGKGSSYSAKTSSCSKVRSGYKVRLLSYFVKIPVLKAKLGIDKRPPWIPKWCWKTNQSFYLYVGVPGTAVKGKNGKLKLVFDDDGHHEQG